MKNARACRGNHRPDRYADIDQNRLGQLQATIKAMAPGAEVRLLGGRRLRDRLYR
jgi:hypothetical protein